MEGPLRLHADIEIHRPAAEVFDYLSNFENNPVWQDGMDRAWFTSEPPLAVGSTYEQVAHFLGREIKSSFEVIAFTPGESVEIKTVESTFDIQVVRRVEALSEQSCRVTADIDGAPLSFPFSIFNPIMGWMAQRSVTKDYAKLKTLLESGG